MSKRVKYFRKRNLCLKRLFIRRCIIVTAFYQSIRILSLGKQGVELNSWSKNLGKKLTSWKRRKAKRNGELVQKFSQNIRHNELASNDTLFKPLWLYLRGILNENLTILTHCKILWKEFYQSNHWDELIIIDSWGLCFKF